MCATSPARTASVKQRRTTINSFLIVAGWAFSNTPGRDPVYWIEFWTNGRQHRESSGSTREDVFAGTVGRAEKRIASIRRRYVGRGKGASAA